MYQKGANVLHTLRYVVGDTDKWRELLRGMNEEFWHATVKTADFEAYVSEQLDYDLAPFFDQYLRTTEIPILKYSKQANGVAIWWDNVVSGFQLPVVVTINGEEQRLEVTQVPTPIRLEQGLATIEVDRNYYVELEEYQPEE